MNKELIKSELKAIKRFDISYQEIKKVLNELIKDDQKRANSNQYIIDFEGDFVFKGSFQEVENYIKTKLLKKYNLKSYGLTTPTEEDIVLICSDDFGHLFK